MKIAIIGSGNVGGTLGKRWAAGGHSVVFSARQGREAAVAGRVAEAGANARVAAIAEAIQESEVLLLATPWDAVEGVLRDAGDLTGKILIDATNPLLPTLDGLAVGKGQSGGELVGGWAKGAKVVKAFNTVGANIMADPAFGGGRVALFYCGDDGDAKQAVRLLIEELGFEALDAGPLSQARLLEPFALLWITLALKYGYTREIAFELLRRS